jgi:hypothetical protein
MRREKRALEGDWSVRRELGLLECSEEAEAEAKCSTINIM